MKETLFTMAMLIIALMSYSQSQKEINWYNFEEAIALNKENPKLIFIDVFTDWCGWCKKMDASTFQDPAIAQYMNEKYYCIKFNAENTDTLHFMGRQFYNNNPDGRRSTHQLAALLLQNKMSYPSYVFMNEENKVLTVVKGFLDTNKFDPIIHWFGERVYLKKSFKDYSQSYVPQK